jgi:hypothetical protein
MKIPAKHIPHNLTSEDKRRIAFAICERIGRGELLSEISEEEGMPCSDTFLNWCKADLEIALAYAGSKEDRIERLMSEMLRIADEKVPTYKDKRDNVRMDPSATADKRLRVNIRRWLITVLVSHRSRTSSPTDSPASTVSAPAATPARNHQQPTGHPLENPQVPAPPLFWPPTKKRNGAAKLPFPMSKTGSQLYAALEDGEIDEHGNPIPLTGSIVPTYKNPLLCRKSPLSL